jgi:hypothetical protein
MAASGLVVLMAGSRVQADGTRCVRVNPVAPLVPDPQLAASDDIAFVARFARL